MSRNTTHPTRPPPFTSVRLSQDGKALVFIDSDGLEHTCPTAFTAEPGQPDRELSLLAAHAHLTSMAEEKSRRTPNRIRERGYTLMIENFVSIELCVSGPGGADISLRLTLDDLSAVLNDLVQINTELAQAVPSTT